MKKTIIIAISAVTLISCAEMSTVLKDINTESAGPLPLTNIEVVKGLKEALSVGAKNSTSLTSKLDGYYKNPEIFIPFPPEVIKVKEKMTALGMGSQVDKFVMTMNRSAETASKKAAPIFIGAITSMSISDGFTILKGGESAATNFLKEKTSGQLRTEFNPVVKSAIDEVEVTKYWNPVISTYNKIPFIDKQNANLEDYITTKAMDGLFIMLAKEEKSIRKDPLARVSDILKRVFG